MKRIALLAALAGCGKSKPAVETVALPHGAGDPVGTAVMYLRYVDGALVEIDRDSIFGDRSKPFRAIDVTGTLVAPRGTFAPAPPHEDFPPKAPRAVFVDRDARAADVLPVIRAALHDRCWGLAVADVMKLELSEPDPCPAEPHAGHPAIEIRVSGRHLWVSSSALEPPTEIDDTKLDGYLREVRARPGFEKHTIVAFSFDPDETIQQVVETVAMLRATDFTWVTR